MRIIGGSFKGKKILQPNDIKTRPLKDLTKESIFNIINHSNKFSINLNYAYVLDLYSGVGSFGIECLSRGAKKVIFMEKYTKVLPILKKNIESLRSINNYEILDKNIDEENTFSNLYDKFDIIFLDPLYKDKNLFNVLSKIEKNKILKQNGIIIMHRHKNEKDIFPSNFRILEEKKYGISKIIFMNYLK